MWLLISESVSMHELESTNEVGHREIRQGIVGLHIRLRSHMVLVSSFEAK